MAHIKLPPKKCNSCGYSASGGAFKRVFGNWWIGREKCPKCNSKDIVNCKKSSVSPVPARQK